jgi:hypothetical protein
LGCADGDEYYLRMANSFGQIAGKAQPMVAMTGQQCIHPFFEEGHAARLKQLNARSINVHANDLMPKFGEACGCYETDITGSNNSDMERSDYLCARHIHITSTPPETRTSPFPIPARTGSKLAHRPHG